MNFPTKKTRIASHKQESSKFGEKSWFNRFWIKETSSAERTSMHWNFTQWIKKSTFGTWKSFPSICHPPCFDDSSFYFFHSWILSNFVTAFKYLTCFEAMPMEMADWKKRFEMRIYARSNNTHYKIVSGILIIKLSLPHFSHFVVSPLLILLPFLTSSFPLAIALWFSKDKLLLKAT